MKKDVKTFKDVHGFIWHLGFDGTSISAVVDSGERVLLSRWGAEPGTIHSRYLARGHRPEELIDLEAEALVAGSALRALVGPPPWESKLAQALPINKQDEQIVDGLIAKRMSELGAHHGIHGSVVTIEKSRLDELLEIEAKYKGLCK